MATLAESMPQFALLLVLTLLPMQLVFGPATPRERMPVWLLDAMQNPSSFRQLRRSVLSRTAGLGIVWPEVLMIAIITAVYFATSRVTRTVASTANLVQAVTDATAPAAEAPKSEAAFGAAKPKG